MEIIYAIFWTIFCLFIWFETDAIIRYSRVFRLTSLFNDLKKYKEHQEESLEPLDYLDFVRNEHPNSFFIALLTCQSCLGFWISLGFCLLFSSWFYLPMVYVTSLIVYLLMRRLTH